MKSERISRLFLASVLFVVGQASAEDIDLFVGAPPNPYDAPNVLIVIDNTANWNSTFAAEKEALASVVNNLPVDKFRLGLMFFTETGNPNKGDDGGYVRAAVRYLDVGTKQKYVEMINAFDVGADKSNGGKSAVAMEEAYRYFGGLAPYSGNSKGKADYFGNTYGNSADDAVHALVGTPLEGGGMENGNALSAFAAGAYNSPRISGCAKNFVIYISNGAAMENSNDTTRSNARLAGFGGDTSVIPLSPALPQDSKMDEWARFMKREYGVVTYTIEAAKSSQHTGAWSRLLRSSAEVTNGKYIDVSDDPSSANISDALNSIFSEIQSVNSVFASVSLPVSVNTQGTYLNQVFIGMFRPDGQARPLWAGNLKQYKMGFRGNAIELQDADSGSAISSSGSGFIYECARSYWTPTAGDSYWDGVITDANCLGRSAASNTPDGNLVEKGGQGYKTRGISPASRVVMTCNTGCTSLVRYNTTNVSKSQLGNSAMSDSEHLELVEWAAGKNNARDLQGDGGVYLNPEERVAAAPATAIRPSVHGDVVHSRPVAINYGTDVEGSTDGREVVVFYGANDGTLRAVNGNQDGEASVGGVGAGRELWAFIPPEFNTKVKRLRDNSNPISFPGSISSTARPKPYGFDGPITAYKEGDTVRLFATMRRGGRAIYAFNIDDPADPQLLWKGGCSGLNNDTCVDDAYDEIGQTWSSMKVIKAEGYTSAPLLAMGGGYHLGPDAVTCEDVDVETLSGYMNHNCDPRTRGKRVFIIDSETGVVKKTFTTKRSVVADLTVVPDEDGNVAFLYAVDMGGNVYRISGASATTAINDTHPNDWTMTRVADLGCAGTADCNPNRKFMFAPDVVIDNGVHHIMVGSGDREKPLGASVYPATAQVNNYFYMLRDVPTSSTWRTPANGASSSGYIQQSSLLEIGSGTPTASELATKPLGWRLRLAAGEQVVNSPLTIYGVISFSTSEPTPPVRGQCTSLGTARVYNINYLDASPVDGVDRFAVLPGGGLPPSAVGGLVLIDGKPYPFCIGCSKDSPLQAGKPSTPPIATQPKAKVYWNIEQ